MRATWKNGPESCQPERAEFVDLVRRAAMLSDGDYTQALSPHPASRAHRAARPAAPRCVRRVSGRGCGSSRPAGPRFRARVRGIESAGAPATRAYPWVDDEMAFTQMALASVLFRFSGLQSRSDAPLLVYAKAASRDRWTAVLLSVPVVSTRGGSSPRDRRPRPGARPTRSGCTRTAPPTPKIRTAARFLSKGGAIAISSRSDRKSSWSSSIRTGPTRSGWRFPRTNSSPS